MKSSLHSLIPFLPLFCQLPTLETPAVLILAAFEILVIQPRSGPTENTAFLLLRVDLLLQRYVYRTVTYQRLRRGSTENAACNTSCLTSQRTWHVPLLRVYGPLASNGCFSASTIFALSNFEYNSCNIFNTLTITTQIYAPGSSVPFMSGATECR
jgi:hypothetical protein